MKKILVPTDFSPVADNAVQYAIEMAATFNSELYLYHMYYIHKVDYHLDFPEDEQPYTKRVERSMNLTRLKFNEKFTQKGLSVKTIVEQGNMYSLFKTKVKEHGINLIVMGSKGASGLEKVIFGSVASTALETAKVPVLVVPPGHFFHPIEHIVLAMDDQEISQTVLSPLQKLALIFGARVTVLNANSDLDENGHQKNDLQLVGVETTYREVPMLNNVNQSINDFVEKEDCDLLCMVRREKGFFKSIFKKSITKAQVFNSKVPLLVLPEKL